MKYIGDIYIFVVKTSKYISSRSVLKLIFFMSRTGFNIWVFAIIMAHNIFKVFLVFGCADI